jgi:hypothetical protein
MANHVLDDGNAPSKTLTPALITPGVSPERAADTNPNRRQLITGATVIGSGALVASAAGAAILAAPAIGANRVSSTFAEKAQAFRKASAAGEAFAADRVGPANDRWAEATRAWRAACDALPHAETKGRYKDAYNNIVRPMSSAGEDLRIARVFVALPSKVDHNFNAVCRELVELVEGREAEKQRLRGDFNIPELERAVHEAEGELARFDEATALAQDAFLACPCVSSAELAEKIALIAEYDLWELSEAQEAIVADARRQAERA